MVNLFFAFLVICIFVVLFAGLDYLNLSTLFGDTGSARVFNSLYTGAKVFESNIYNSFSALTIFADLAEDPIKLLGFPHFLDIPTARSLVCVDLLNLPEKFCRPIGTPFYFLPHSWFSWYFFYSIHCWSFYSFSILLLSPHQVFSILFAVLNFLIAYWYLSVFPELFIR